MKSFIASLLILFTLTACSSTYVTDRKTVLQMANDTNVEIGNWCSGTVVNKKERLIATARHCVDVIAEKFQYQTWSEKEKKYVWHTITKYEPFTITHRRLNGEGKVLETVKLRGFVVAVDQKNDVALVWTDSAYDFKDEAVLSSTPVKYGDFVFNIGNPYLIPTVLATGHVVAPRMNTKIVYFIPVDAIITDAAIAGGHSGGATYNANGEYIGMTNWKPPSSNHSILLPVRYLKKLMKEYYDKEGIITEKPEGTFWSGLKAYLGS